VVVRWQVAAVFVGVCLACGGGGEVPDGVAAPADDAGAPGAVGVAEDGCEGASRHASHPDGPSAVWVQPIRATSEGGSEPLVPPYDQGMSMTWCEVDGRPVGPVELAFAAWRVRGELQGGRPVGRWSGGEQIGDEAIELWHTTFDSHGLQQGAFRRGWGVGDMGSDVGQFLDGHPSGDWTFAGEGDTTAMAFEHGLAQGAYVREHGMVEPTTVEGSFDKGHKVGVWTTTKGDEVIDREDHGS